MAEKFIAKAHHAYTKAKPDEIDLSPGDIIRVTNNEHDAWWVGHNESTKERGWFPSNFVKVEAKSSRTKTKRHVRCIKQYIADDDDEDALSLEVGDMVEVGRELEGWYFGTVDGRKGLFPASHVEDIGGPSSAKDMADKAPPPVHRPLPVPPVPSGATSPPPLPPTMLSRQGFVSPQPPVLPQRQPPLPPRASTDIPRGSDKRFSSALGADDTADDGAKKEKQKSGHRISRLFGTKKNKHRDAAEPSDIIMSPQAEEPQKLDDDDHDEPLEEETEEEIAISPAPPSRPLPQPTAVSPPASARPPLPPIPSMSLTKPPPVPAAAIPPPPAAVAATPQRPSSSRRLSVSSVKSASATAIADIDATAGTEDGPIDEVADEETESVAEQADGNESIKSRGGGAKLAKIIEDYEAQQQEELNLMSGDVVTIISRGTEDDPRWKGEYHGKKGYFPAHVIDAIEESADLEEEEGESGAKPRGGFRLAAYGVQQGGIGSIFAGGGLPSLRKAAPPRKTDEDEGQAAVPAPAPALAPVIPKLRSIQRPPAAAPKDEPKEEQVNFLAQLSRVPRRQTSSIPNEDSVGSPLMATPAAAPPLPLSRRSTAASAGDSMAHSSIPDITASVADDVDEEEVEAAAEEAADIEETPSAKVPDLPVDDIADAEVPEDEAQEEVERELQTDEVDAEEQMGADEDLETSSRTSSLDPVKSPALAGVKRLVRRAPRQKPTAEGLKKQSEESQSQSLHSALKKDKDLAPEPEHEPARAAPPVLPEKPKGLARHGQFSGPQLPTGGFKASGRVASGMASRLAALQARASGGGADEDASEDNNAPLPVVAPSSSRALPSAVRAPPAEIVPSPQASKKPASFNARTEPPTAVAAVSPEWQQQIEAEQARLRGDVDAAKRANVDAAKRASEQVDQLASQLAASERENMAHKQTISGLERQIESLAAQLAALQSNLSGIQRSVATLESNKGVSASEVANIMRDELKTATQPLQEQNQELRAETKVLHKSIAALRAYVDELVVEEEQ